MMRPAEFLERFLRDFRRGAIDPESVRITIVEARDGFTRTTSDVWNKAEQKPQPQEYDDLAMLPSSSTALKRHIFEHTPNTGYSNLRPEIPNHGKLWSPYLDRILVYLYTHHNLSVPLLCEMFGRTDGGILSRLKRFDLIHWDGRKYVRNPAIDDRHHQWRWAQHARNDAQPEERRREVYYN